MGREARSQVTGQTSTEALLQRDRRHGARLSQASSAQPRQELVVGLRKKRRCCCSPCGKDAGAEGHIQPQSSWPEDRDPEGQGSRRNLGRRSWPGRSSGRALVGSAQIRSLRTVMEVRFHFFCKESSCTEPSLPPSRLRLQRRLTHPSLTRHPCSAVPPAGISAPRSFRSQAPASGVSSNASGFEGWLFHYCSLQHLKSFLQEPDSFKPCAKHSKQSLKPSTLFSWPAPGRSTR